MSVRHVSEFGLKPVAAGEGTETQVLIGPDQGFLTTQQFLDKLDQNLQAKMG